MNLPTTFILYLTFFRLAIIAAGVISITLGYRLFIKGVGWEGGTDVSAEVHGSKFTFKNAAPGTCFGLFGAFIIGVMFATGGPELTLGYMQKAASATSVGVDSTVASQSSKSDEFTLTMRGNGADSMATANKLGVWHESRRDTVSAIAAYEKALNFVNPDPLNNLAWLYLHKGNIDGACALSRVAVHLAPGNANYLDTFAEALLQAGNHEEGRRVMEKAARLDGRYKAKLHKFDKSALK